MRCLTFFNPMPMAVNELLLCSSIRLEVSSLVIVAIGRTKVLLIVAVASIMAVPRLGCVRMLPGNRYRSA